MIDEATGIARPRFSVHARLKSFVFAGNGLRHLFFAEHNMRLHGLAAVAAIGFGVVLRIDRQDWLWIVLAITLVWMAEAFNTAVERLADAVTMERNPRIAIVKDTAAAGVLLSAISALVIGVLVFGPHLLVRL